MAAKIRTVLIVDDHVWTRRLMKEVLKDRGYEVVEAGDCGDALDLLDTLLIDVIVTDIIMPGDIEGMEFIATVRERNPDVPIIAISAGGSSDRDGYLETAMALGASATVAKPFEPEDLIAPIDALAEG